MIDAEAWQHATMVPKCNYSYTRPDLSHSHDYLLPVLERLLNEIRPAKIFDLGCGNGSVANQLCRLYEVEGIDASEDAVRVANEHFPHIRIELGSAYDDLAAKFGQYPVVISLEVVEHLYSPRLFARTIYNLVQPGGAALISTPYHGYFKNLALALTGKLDQHFTALWDDGHIKFWSERTLTALMREAGFESIRFVRAGRISPLAMSMIAVCGK
jgi:2-polyprenyl-6-hydroxyphenyl methylase/3-demethylubiquinone-9 3-methyltransferase